MDEKRLLKVINNAFEKKLTTLNLFYNQLTQLPTEIGDLTNLTFLDLGGNQLTQLPIEIIQLTNLERLDIRENRT